MAKRWYVYRRGDGNEGNFPRFTINLEPDETWAALPALLINDYIAGKRVRKHIIRNMPHVDGEPEYGVSVGIDEGPDGEQAFGACWLTAELQPIEGPDDYPSLHAWEALRPALDRGAWDYYKKRAAE